MDLSSVFWTRKDIVDKAKDKVMLRMKFFFQDQGFEWSVSDQFMVNSSICHSGTHKNFFLVCET